MNWQRNLLICIVSIFSSATTLATSSLSQVQQEKIYRQAMDRLLKHPHIAHFSFLSLDEKKLYVDAVWDLVTVSKNKEIQNSISNLDFKTYALADQLRLELLQNWPKEIRLSQSLIDEIHNHYLNQDLDLRTRTLLQVYAQKIKNKGILSVLEKKSLAPQFRTKTKEEIQDLFFRSPSLESYNDGEYKDSVRLFMFCRKNRVYPCLFLMKDKNNQPVYKEDGKTLWHQPALGLSKFRIPSSRRNGHTPAGVQTMNSVMPSPEPVRTYGKYRRIILNFVPNSEGDIDTKKFLPESAHNKSWWKAASVSRDAGRTLLRIHGTGRIKTTSRDPNHPLRSTLGCVMQREGKVGRVTYKDQRKLLDQSMKALDLPLVYENETQIKGVLYLVELDNKARSVKYSDLKKYLGL